MTCTSTNVWPQLIMLSPVPPCLAVEKLKGSFLQATPFHMYLCLFLTHDGWLCFMELKLLPYLSHTHPHPVSNFWFSFSVWWNHTCSGSKIAISVQHVSSVKDLWQHHPAFACNAIVWMKQLIEFGCMQLRMTLLLHLSQSFQISSTGHAWIWTWDHRQMRTRWTDAPHAKGRSFLMEVTYLLYQMHWGGSCHLSTGDV